MDLISLGLCNSIKEKECSIEAISILRTMSWQRIVNIPTSKKEDRNTCIKRGAYCSCWSPDGRFLAIGFWDGSVKIFSVDDCSSLASSSVSAIHSIVKDDCNIKKAIKISSPVVTRSVALRRKIEAELSSNASDDNPEKVIMLIWMMMNVHPMGEELQNEFIWSLKSRYLDRDSHFIPTKKKAIISSKTPLSLLCIMSSCANLDLYLHGRYLICSLPCVFSETPENIMLSGDLTTLLLKQENSFCIYYMQNIYIHRHDLQQISSSYIMITELLETMKKTLKQACTQWSNALRPLETKLTSFKDLLRDFDLEMENGEIILNAEFFLIF